jgi:hypothetical protein
MLYIQNVSVQASFVNDQHLMLCLFVNCSTLPVDCMMQQSRIYKMKWVRVHVLGLSMSVYFDRKEMITRLWVLKKKKKIPLKTYQGNIYGINVKNGCTVLFFFFCFSSFVLYTHIYIHHFCACLKQLRMKAKEKWIPTLEGQKFALWTKYSFSFYLLYIIC